jgi:hypothetical protein
LAYYPMVKLMVCFIQVGWMTSDNASNNDMAMKEVAHKIDPDGVQWTPATHHIRCQEHILNLVAQHFVDAIMKKTYQALDKGDDSKLYISDADHENDSLGKVLAHIKQIHYFNLILILCSC